MDVIAKVTEILAKIAKERNLEIVEVAYKREGSSMVLRILLDKEGGITLNECSKVNNELGEILDKGPVIEEHYMLEVCSPGLDRAMKTDRDFEKALNKNIKVTTYGPIGGKNVFIGKLLGITSATIVVEDSEGVSAEIPREKIAKASLEIILA